MRRMVVLVAAVVMSGVLVGVGGFLFLTRSVPDLRSFSADQAVATILDEGFTVGGRTEDFSTTVLRGRVMAQDPDPGARVRPGTDIAIVVSRGPAAHVPNLVGRSRAAALLAIDTANLEARTTEVSSESAPAGEVIRQDLVPGLVVEEGTTVELVISTGPATTDVVVNVRVYDGYDSCSFSLGYYDIPGGTVQIEADGRIVGSGTLPFSGVDHAYYCEYTTVVPDIPMTASSYSLTTDRSSRGSVTNSRAEMADADWTFTVTLGL